MPLEDALQGSSALAIFESTFASTRVRRNRYPFHADTPHPSIPELEETPVEEEQQDEWEINTNEEIPDLGNFENTE